MVNKVLVLSKASSASSSALARLYRSADGPNPSSPQFSAQRDAQQLAQQPANTLQQGGLAACHGSCYGSARAPGPSSARASRSCARETPTSSPSSPASSSASPGKLAGSPQPAHSQLTARAHGPCGMVAAVASREVSAPLQLAPQGLPGVASCTGGPGLHMPSKVGMPPLRLSCQGQPAGSGSGEGARRLDEAAGLVSSRTRAATAAAQLPSFPFAVPSDQSPRPRQLASAAPAAPPSASQPVAAGASPCPVFPAEVRAQHPSSAPSSSERRAQRARAALTAAARAAAIDAAAACGGAVAGCVAVPSATPEHSLCGAREAVRYHMEFAFNVLDGHLSSVC